MDLVSGYDSDSDEEKPAISLSSILPAPSPSTSTGLNLPPPSSSSLKPNLKRKLEKRQIRIDALNPIDDEKEDDSISHKRAKPPVDSNSGKSGLSGLLGLLPAPKQIGPPSPALDKGKDEAAISNTGVLAGSESRMNLDTSIVETKKAKGNNDFRAMLGLKPSKLPERVNPIVPNQPSVPIVEVSKIPVVAAEEGKVSLLKHSDFFTLSERSTTLSSDKIKSVSSISTAPDVEDEQIEAATKIVDDQDHYKGWQQGPDGNWFPVTPQAHAAYNKYLSTQAINPDLFADRPADMKYGDINKIQSIDANQSRQAWETRPSTEVNSSSSELDRKYAIAAASIAMPDQGIPLVDQEEEVKKMDKKTNFRARRKGQLSSLIAQAEENREKLEERWSKGKDGRNAAKVKYGF